MAALNFQHRIPSGLLESFERSPRVFMRHLDRAARRGAQEGARQERRLAPKGFSTLTQSIGVDRLGAGVYRFGPSVDYAEMVEQGTGRGGFPPIPGLMAWIRVKRIQPRDDTMTAEDLAYAMARSIVRRGTPAQPFVAPVAEKLPSRLMELMDQALVDALTEARLQ
ncbi:MAG: hypothetical protein AB7Q81_24365 [Gammaproteobacteria bacterium]